MIENREGNLGLKGIRRLTPDKGDKLRAEGFPFLALDNRNLRGCGMDLSSPFYGLNLAEEGNTQRGSFRRSTVVTAEVVFT